MEKFLSKETNMFWLDVKFRGKRFRGPLPHVIPRRLYLVLIEQRYRRRIKKPNQVVYLLYLFSCNLTIDFKSNEQLC